VADVVGPAASLVTKLKRKWSTIFGRLPINYCLYEWVDPRFAPQWEKSQGVVYLETSSPIRANHRLKKFIVFQKAQYTTEDWIRYIERCVWRFQIRRGTLTANTLSRASESQNIGTTIYQGRVLWAPNRGVHRRPQNEATQG
jgi:hypothetical protein